MGFLHPELTTNTRYIIINDYLDNVEESVRVATGVECSPLQVYVTVGYIGLIIHLAFFISLWVFVRRLKYSWYFLSILLLTFILGLSGMTKWIDNTGQFLLALSFSAVLLENHDQLWSHIHLRSLNPSAQSVTKEIIDEQHK